MKYEVVIPDDLLADCKSIGSSKKIKLVLKCLRDITVKDAALQEHLELSQHDLIKLYADVVVQKYVTLYRTQETGQKIYIVNPSFASLHVVCESCPMSKTKEVDIGKNNVTVTLCSSDINCVYNYWRTVLNAYWSLKATYTLVKCTPEIIRSNASNKTKPLVEWGDREFYFHIKDKYKQVFQETRVKVSTIKLRVQVVMDYVKSVYPANWRSVLKQYIDIAFKEASRGSDTLSFNSLDSVQNFKRLSKEIVETYQCKRYKIFCYNCTKTSECSRHTNLSECTAPYRRRVRNGFN